MDAADLVALQRQLGAERLDLADLEHTYLRSKVEAFQYTDAKTVKEREMIGEAAALDIHRDLVRQRAVVRSMEDSLKVALHAIS